MDFEASGGLVNSSLVMQDQQTDTYWSIMEGKAISGELEGERLKELPVGEKIQWRHWKGKYPETRALSIDGREDAPDAYRAYFRDEDGFRGQAAEDERLSTKAPIFAFHHGGAAFAAEHRTLVGGKPFQLGDETFVLLYRSNHSSMFRSTLAFVSSAGFTLDDGSWVEKGTGARLDPTAGTFGAAVRLGGFDTFWYNFSLNNPNATLLE